MYRLENVDVIHMCSVSSWDPIGVTVHYPVLPHQGKFQSQNLTLLLISEKEEDQRTFDF